MAQPVIEQLWRIARRKSPQKRAPFWQGVPNEKVSIKRSFNFGILTFLVGGLYGHGAVALETCESVCASGEPSEVFNEKCSLRDFLRNGGGEDPYRGPDNTEHCHRLDCELTQGESGDAITPQLGILNIRWKY